MFILDQLVLAVNPFSWQQETVAWSISYIMDIYVQYFLHEWLVFGKQPDRCKAIIGCYFSYTTAIVLSIIINGFLINQMAYSNNLAWFLTLALTGILNYFLVTYFMKSTPPKHKDEERTKLKRTPKFNSDVIVL